MDTVDERIEQLKAVRPAYKEILDFYQKVREEQERGKGSLKVGSIPLKKDGKDLVATEHLPLFRKQDFPLDTEACIKLFQSLCKIAAEANPFMLEQVQKIEEEIERGRVDLKALLKDGLKDEMLEQTADQFGFDRSVFFFLIQNSAKPSIEAAMKEVAEALDADAWLKGVCPVCGSLPSLAILGEAAGQRSLLCSFCGYEWSVERVRCPFCHNNERESLHYFYGEDEESHRIDVCEKCRQYIKTLDRRKANVSDPVLEDLATLHLDIVAHQKGYQRPARMFPSFQIRRDE